MYIGVLINIDLGSVNVYRCVNQHRFRGVCMSIGVLINIDLGSVNVYRCVNQHRFRACVCL